MVVHLWRRGQLERSGFCQEQEAIGLRRGVQRRALFLPVRDQFIQRAWFQHRAGQDVAADLAGFLHQTDCHLGVELLQPDRR